MISMRLIMSCVAVVEGCMNVLSEHYNSSANTQDASCEFFGCMDDYMTHYNANANASDTSQCHMIGCTYDWAFNYRLRGYNGFW